MLKTIESKSSKVLSWSSKNLSLISLQRHHKRHKDTIFQTTTLEELSVVHQLANKLTTRVGITQGNPNRLKNTIQMAQSIPQ
jgi:hypothetical protein